MLVGQMDIATTTGKEKTLLMAGYVELQCRKAGDVVYPITIKSVIIIIFVNLPNAVN